MPSEIPSTTVQTSNELNLFINQGDAVIRGLAACALNSDSGSDMRAAVSAAGKLAESIEYVRQLGESEHRIIVGHLGLVGLEAAATPTAVAAFDAGTSDVMTDEVVMSDMAEVLPGIKLSRPASVVIGTLVHHPGQWFSPIELRQRVGDLASTDSARAQAVVKALQRVRYSPYASQLDIDGETRTRRYRWVPADAAQHTSPQEPTSVVIDDIAGSTRQSSAVDTPASAEGRTGHAAPTPKDVMRSFTSEVHLGTVPVQPTVVMSDAFRPEVGAIPDQVTDTQELVGIDKDIQVVVERYGDMSIGIDRRDDGGLVLHQHNIPVRASQQVIELFVKVAAVDDLEYGYTIPDLINYFHPVQEGGHKDVRREHVENKRTLFKAINHELPELTEQLLSGLELKRNRVKYHKLVALAHKQGGVEKGTDSLLIVRKGALV